MAKNAHKLLYNTILFDLDGTLIESGPCIFAVMHAMLARMGLPDMTDAEMRPVVGPPLRTGIRDVIRVPAERVDEAAGIYRELSHTIGLDLVKPYDGMPELLASLKAAGATLCIATSKVTRVAREHAALYGIDGYFDHIFGAVENGTAEKIDILTEAKRTLSDAGRTFVMIGDRCFDIEAATAVGLPSIAVAYGYGEMSELTAANPTYIVDTVGELKKLLLSERS